ncbi:class I SAM-dependent methyltransferase [Aeromicrobium sp. Sec7.5]|uniref:class I SAM-dependent methyltransferase n=1 Tax=Aeromicrobium sp. Sec7.5 TaxID=3121276 RepID=UPI002FE4DFE0
MHPAIRAVVRPPVLAVNTPIARRRAKTAFASAPRPFKLEIGGLVPREGWVVTNVSAVTRHFLDATAPWPLEDASLSHVYSDNVVEHITLQGAQVLFAEAFRCLQPGGAIRMVTPDLRAHVDKYLAGVAPKGDPSAKVYEQIGLTVEHPIDWVRIPIAEFGHHHGYLWDFETMAAELTRAGFSDIKRYEHGESDRPELAGIDMRADEGGVQLVVEATR